MILLRKCTHALFQVIGSVVLLTFGLAVVAMAALAGAAFMGALALVVGAIVGLAVIGGAVLMLCSIVEPDSLMADVVAELRAKRKESKAPGNVKPFPKGAA